MATFTDAITTANNVYLNDAAAKAYTASRMFLVAKEAFRFLKQEMGVADDQVFRDIEVVAYTANAGTITGFTNLLKPVSLEERDANSSSVHDYRPIFEQMWELGAGRDTSENLRYWSWRENAIKCLPATTNRTVRGYFDKFLTDPASAGDTIGITGGEEYLAAKMSALASAFIGNNPQRAQECEAIAERSLQNLLALSAKANQSLVIKRRPYKGRRPYYVSSR